MNELIKRDAERADKAKRNLDWSLYAHICKNYPLGSEHSKAFGDELIRLSNEYRAANPPEYFK
jgi:hypothetical protein